MIELPHLTGDLPGIGGRIKQCPEDFRVDEIPLYEACGEGTHVYFQVVKTSLPTPQAISRIARCMGVRPADIGVAGLKDARAVTSQWMSLEHADPDKLLACRDAQIRVSTVTRHRNKLRPGHLTGNRFVIRIRDVGERELAQARAILDVLVLRGVPNYFGPQRFGARADTDLLGEALVRGNMEEFVAILLGRGRSSDPPDCRAARQAFDAGDLTAAMRHWPRHYSDQRRALAAYRRKKRPAAAAAAVDKRMKRLYVSALQSAIFNDVLSRRIQSVDRVEDGDLARKIDTGGIFSVEDAAVEQPRAEAFEISPTGPIPGYRCNLAGGQPGVIEREALARRDLQLDDFRHVGAMKCKGTRRALRFALKEPAISAGADGLGQFIELTFTAPSGCYATVAVEEIIKTPA